MGFWDDDDFEEEMEDLDDYDRLNNRGLYEKNDDSQLDSIDELGLMLYEIDELEDAGIDMDEFYAMSPSERKEALEEAGLDPDDYDLDYED